MSESTPPGSSLESSLHVGFVGGGNMAGSLIGGLVASGHAPAQVHVAELDDERRRALARDYGVAVTDDLTEVARAASVVVLAVKPQGMDGVTAALGAVDGVDPLYISVAAGVRDSAMRAHLGAAARIVRCMPNTPALVRAGITGLYASETVSDTERATAEGILGAVGETLWVDDEGALDAVTAVSGSGPAYFFRMIELLEAKAVDLGLPADAARRLAEHTGLGAATLAVASDEAAGTLRERVTSPGGTTAAALDTLDKGGFPALFDDAVQAAFDRSKELGQ